MLILIALALGVGFLYFSNSRNEPSESKNSPSFMKKVTDLMSDKKERDKVDYKAGFAIFTHGTFRVFTAAMYHNLSDDVFIQADNPNTVHIKKSGITWDDFFKTLPFKLTTDCLTTGAGETFCTGQDGKLKFFLNGVENDNLLDIVIADGDRALISFGNESEEQIKNQIDKIPQ